MIGADPAANQRHPYQMEAYKFSSTRDLGVASANLHERLLKDATLLVSKLVNTNTWSQSLTRISHTN